MTPKDLLGAFIKCPGCGAIAQIVRIMGTVSEVDGSRGVKVQLSDGYEAKFWLSGPRAEDGPKDYAGRN